MLAFKDYQLNKKTHQSELMRTVDVQDADEGGSIWVLPDGAVDLVHQPVEQALVQRLCQGVPVAHRRLHVDGADDGPCTSSMQPEFETPPQSS